MSLAQEKHPYTNRLINEKSPYLLQHAHNPVDWYAWGKEAFTKAKSEDKPILLSIGYSTCHWCHVMEEESFEDPGIAEVMNRHFVAIKVDREERPDIDAIYMNYVIATTGSGGWPTTLFLTPDRKPFYGGTYFPPEDRFGLTGFKTLLLSIADAWTNRKEEIVKSSDSAVSYLQSQSTGGGGLELTEDVLTDAFESFQKRFDGLHGGFGSAPKFPMGHALSFLLRYWHRTGNAEALEMTEKTLKAMAAGGITDQLGGGFHRYSTDREWFLPHFEKMLYDQALLCRPYLEAAQATQKEEYAAAARGILDYVLKEMTAPEGGFYSAQDADSPDPDDPSQKKEGAFYVWKKSQIEKILPQKDAAIFEFHFGVKEEGNVKQDPHGEFTGKNVLYSAHSLEETASHFKISAEEARRALENSRKALLAARSKRPPMHLDDKVLTDWNGLMISSFAIAANALGEPRYRVAAFRAGDFVVKHLKTKEGTLLHRYRDGGAGITGTLDDYAFFIQASLDLYEASFDERWLKEARELSDKMIELFWDEKKGGFYLTPKDAEPLITRPKSDTDGAIPSGNAVAALALFKLGRMTGDAKYERAAGDTLKAFSELVSSQPTGFSQMLAALDFAIGPSREIVIASDQKGLSVIAVLKEIHSRFTPNKVVLLHKAGPDGGAIEGLAPFLKDYTARDGKTAVYICRNRACELPVADAAELARLLGKK
ncbi:MAG: thioredoxin domain-containing protein [Candidatus Omnitrophota bacterium]